MPLYLNEDQTALHDTIRDFVAENAPVSHMRSLRDADDPTGFSRDLWKQFAEMGFTGMMVGEEHGGLGMGHVEAGIVLEEIGRNLSPSPFLSTAVAAVAALKGSGAGERWFPGIVAGETVAALAIDERAKHGGAIALKAERSGNGFKLSGRKRFVAHGHVADLLIVAARTGGSDDDHEGVTLFAVERDAAGLTAAPERLADASIAATLTLEGVEVDADAVIGEIDAGREPLDRLLRAGRVGASAEMLGVGGGAMERTVGYLNERKQFGTLIVSFQAIQHRMVEAYARVDQARSALIAAVTSGEAQEIAGMKAVVAEAALAIGRESVQLHGGMGTTDELEIGHAHKRVLLLSQWLGDPASGLDAYAQVAIRDAA